MENKTKFWFKETLKELDNTEQFKFALNSVTRYINMFLNDLTVKKEQFSKYYVIEKLDVMKQHLDHAKKLLGGEEDDL